MTKLKGFISRPWKSKKTGKTHYTYYYRPPAPRKKGHKDRRETPISLGTNYREAVKKWAELAGEEVESAKAGTIGAIVQAYFDWAKNPKLCKLAERTIEDRKKYWGDPNAGRLQTAFAKVSADNFQAKWALDYFERRSSQASAKKELKFLSALFNWARARGLMGVPNPLAGVFKQFEVEEGRDIYVHQNWFNLVYKHGNQLVKDVMEFTYLCGNRPNESEKAKKSDIDGNEITIRLPKTRKTGISSKTLPIEGALKTYIERQQKRSPSPIWLVASGDGQPFKAISMRFRRAWDKARDAAEAEAKEKKIEFVRFQLMDIRAKAATDMAEEHGIEAARRLLGHTTQKQTADYIRSLKGLPAKAIERLRKV